MRSCVLVAPKKYFANLCSIGDYLIAVYLKYSDIRQKLNQHVE